MKPEAQRIAIAEACGWLVLESHCWEDQAKPCGRHVPDGKWETIPDYLNDLNAMHEAEKVLTNEQWPEYIRHLAGETKCDDWPTCFLNMDACRMIAEQTAAQRAEAFLRTLSLWTD